MEFDDELPSSENLIQSRPDSQASVDTPSTSASALKRKIDQQAAERFNVLMGAPTDFLTKKESRGRNDDFYKVLDSYLIKLPEDSQDNIK